MFETLEFDWFILLLRLLFIFLLYFFLYQVLRVTLRELTTIAAATAEPAIERTRQGGRLVVVDGAESNIPPGTAFPLQTVSIVGRLRDSTIAIDEPFVSAEHAELAFDRGRWWIRDLGSTNGTFLNGTQVTVPTGVRAGDIVQFGRIKLQFAP